MEKKEIELGGRKYFIGKINPIEMMTISQAGIALYKKDEITGEINIDLSSKKNVAALSTFYDLVFEHVFVQLTETMIKPVKEKDVDVWWPENIAEDYSTLFKLSQWFMEVVVFPVFMKSSE